MEAKITPAKPIQSSWNLYFFRSWNPHKSMHQNTLRAWLIKENLQEWPFLPTTATEKRPKSTPYVLSPHAQKTPPLSARHVHLHRDDACPNSWWFPDGIINAFERLSERKKKSFNLFNKRFSEISVKLFDRNLPNTSHLYPPHLQMSRNLSPKQRKRQTSH